MRNVEVSAQEQYIQNLFVSENDLKKQSRVAAQELGLDRISLSANEGRLLENLIRLHQSKKIVEIGTLTGLSAQYIFDGMSDGAELWTLEKSPEHCEKAQAVFSLVDQSKKKIHLIAGDAREKLKEISTHAPFDAVFIDGNKAAYWDYLEWAEAHLKSGGMIVGDNVFLSGAVYGETTQQKFSEKQVRIMCDFNARLANSDLYHSVLIPTFEGLFVAIKK